MSMTAIRTQTERKRQDRSVRRAEKCGPSGHDDAGSRLDPASSGHFFNHGHRSERKEFDQRADSCDFFVQRQATWGMSVKDKGLRPCLPGRKSRRKAIRYDRCPKVFLSAIALAATVMFWL